MEKINSKNFENENEENLNLNEENLNENEENEIVIQKVKDIDLISSFNDSCFLNDDENENENENHKNLSDNKNKNKNSEINLIYKIKENNILTRENDNLKKKLNIISNNSQKLLKILENPQR